MPYPATKQRKFKRQTEESVQQRICTYMKRNYPNVLFFADGSGVKMSDTKRISMGKMRSKDFRVPDLIVDHPSRGYNGMRLEIKPEGTVVYKKDGTLRKQGYRYEYYKYGKKFIYEGDHLKEQAASLKKLNEAGYFARFAIGYDSATKLIDWYMERPEQTELF